MLYVLYVPAFLSLYISASRLSFAGSKTAGPLLKKMTYAEDKNETTTTDYIDNSLFSTTVQEYDWEGNVIREECVVVAYVVCPPAALFFSDSVRMFP